MRLEVLSRLTQILLRLSKALTFSGETRSLLAKLCSGRDSMDGRSGSKTLLATHRGARFQETRRRDDALARRESWDTLVSISIETDITE